LITNAKAVSLRLFLAYSGALAFRSASSSVTSASSKFVRCGIVCTLRTMLAAIVFRIRDICSRRIGPQSSRSVDLDSGRDRTWGEALACRTAAITSSRTIRPAGPVPFTRPRSTPNSRARRRTAGPAGSTAATPEGSSTATGAGLTAGADRCGTDTGAAGAAGAGVGAAGTGAAAGWAATGAAVAGAAAGFAAPAPVASSTTSA